MSKYHARYLPSEAGSVPAKAAVGVLNALVLSLAFWSLMASTLLLIAD